VQTFIEFNERRLHSVSLQQLDLYSNDSICVYTKGLLAMVKGKWVGMGWYGGLGNGSSL